LISKKWVKKMGENFTNRFPIIFKYGKFKKALRYYKEDKYIRSYKEIAEAFDIEGIKKKFNENYDPSK
jgi:hypothetical protein